MPKAPTNRLIVSTMCIAFAACQGADGAVAADSTTESDAAVAAPAGGTRATVGGDGGAAASSPASGGAGAGAGAGGAGAAAVDRDASVAGSSGVGSAGSQASAAAGTASAGSGGSTVQGGAGADAGSAGTATAGSAAMLGADCAADPLANLEPLGRGFFQEFRGLFGCTKPADLALYRQMLPEKFEMPADPQVCFYIVHFAVSGVGPYNEAAILMPVEYAGQSGKYVLTMPLDNVAASSGGRAQGFPKYMAEEVSLSDDGNNWTGVVRNAGQVDLQASYTGACTAGGDFPFPDFINLTPIPISASQDAAYLAPRTGSALMITSDLLADPQFYSLQGTVQMQVGDTLPWNGLFDEAQAFPAQLVTFKGGIDLGSRALD
jgi:hypothetical protein